MQKIARLICFISVSFILVFLLASLAGYLRLWLDAASAMPVPRHIRTTDILSAARWGANLAFYAAILLSMNYAIRNKISALSSCLLTGALSFGLLLGVLAGFERLGDAGGEALEIQSAALGEAGVILASPPDSSIVLLDKPALEAGGRVLAAAGHPLIYTALPMGVGGSPMQLPPVTFDMGDFKHFNGLKLDFELSAAYAASRLKSGVLFFAAYFIPLIMILLSISFIMNIGAWSLANLCLSAILFRVVLFLEVFINSPSVIDFFTSFFKGAVPPVFINPLLFLILGVLMLFYVIVSRVSEEKGRQSVR